jgi:hypothetical protein
VKRATLLFLLAAFAACAATGGPAGETVAPKQGPRRSPDDISYMRARGDRPLDGLIEPSIFSFIEPHWFELKRNIRKTTRLDFGMAYTALFQQASDSVAGPDHAGGGDFDLFGQWHLVGDRKENDGLLGFAFEDRHKYGSIAPSKLGESIGSMWPTTRAFDTHEFALIQIYWDQHLLDDQLYFRIGAYDHKTIYEIYTFRSETFYFQNYLFAGNVSFSPPGGGFGGCLTWRPTDETYLKAGIADANGRRAWPELDTFFKQHEYYYFAEFGFSPRFAPYQVGYFHATVWHVDERELAGTEPGTGVALVAQISYDDVIPFLRYAWADAAEPTVYARQNVNGGIGIMRPFGRADDAFAIGIGAGEEVNGSSWQVAAETFYRLQLTAFTQLTLSFQGIFNPVGNPDEDALGLLGARLRFQL